MHPLVKGRGAAGMRHCGGWDHGRMDGLTVVTGVSTHAHARAHIHKLTRAPPLTRSPTPTRSLVSLPMCPHMFPPPPVALPAPGPSAGPGCEEKRRPAAGLDAL
jgi:hypothetical protein